MKRPYALAVGRCPAGLDFEGKNSYEDIRFVFLLLASEKQKIISPFSPPLPIIPGQFGHGSALDGSGQK